MDLSSAIRYWPALMLAVALSSGCATPSRPPEASPAPAYIMPSRPKYECTLTDRPATVVHFVESKTGETRWTVLIDPDTVRALEATDTIDEKGAQVFNRFNEQRCLVAARLREAGLCPLDWYFIDETFRRLLDDGSMAPSGYCRDGNEPAVAIESLLDAPADAKLFPSSDDRLRGQH